MNIDNRRKYVNNFWILLLLFYNSIVLVSFFLATLFSSLATLPFYIFLPGYSFTELFLKFDNILEKFVASLGISLSLFIGLRALIGALFNIYNAPLSLILVIISEIILIVELVYRKIVNLYI